MQAQLLEPDDNSKDFGSIPIRNIWLLMAYAANLNTDFSSKKTSTQSFEENLMDTVAELLCSETKKQLKYGLNLGYEPLTEELSRLRGKIDHLRTARSSSYLRGKIYCTYEKLNHNTLENQIVRISLHKVMKYVKSSQIRFTCKALDSHLGALGIDLFRGNLSSVVSREIDHRRKNSHLLSLAYLALRMDLVSEELGEGNYLSPLKKDAWIYNLFEKAIGGFYRHHLVNTGWIVETGRKHSWPLLESTARLSQILPNMITDIELTNPLIRKKVIIDTKFTKIVKPGRFRDLTLSSGHIYQLYTYLRTSEEMDSERFDSSSGLLLYPAYGENFYEETSLQGHKCVFATVNLLAGPNEIKSELLNIIKRISGDRMN